MPRIEPDEQEWYLSQRRRARREIPDILPAEVRENVILPTLHALAGQK